MGSLMHHCLAKLLWMPDVSDSQEASRFGRLESRIADYGGTNSDVIVRSYYSNRFNGNVKAPGF